ncbi:MAG: DUF2254 family protein [Acidimicrobiia bacterium]|nr:DUF2254 family protein [Acidimicrobiia bacterium]
MTVKRWYRRRRRSASAALRESQWLLPLIGVLIGVFLSLLVDSTNWDSDPDNWAITVDRARDTMMSILAILFAGLAIVLSLSTMTASTVASRFSLRLLVVYLRSMANKVVIAMFMMTTTFMILEQARMAGLAADDLAPRPAVVMSGALLILSGLAIIWHINWTLQSIRVDRTIRRVATSTLRSANTIERARRGYDSATTSSLSAPPGAEVLVAPDSGYYVRSDVTALVQIAEQHRLVICVDVMTGAHLVTGAPYGWVSSVASHAVDEDVRGAIGDALDVEDSRDPGRDVGFGIRILVDIALMALSPAINDPYTAVLCIDQLAVLFTSLPASPSGPMTWTAESGGGKVIVNAPTLGQYLDEATVEIAMYGAGDERVIAALANVAASAERTAITPDDRAAATRTASNLADAASR